jgi:hypothetical protein
MATIVQNQDGTLTVTPTQQEQFTLSGLAPGELEAIVTGILDEKSKIVFQQRFASLPPENQAVVLALFTPAP